MKYRVIFLQTALDDLEEIVLHIARDSKTAAIEIHDKVIGNAHRLETFPQLGMLVPDKKLREAGFRMLIVGKYLLLYKISAGEINVLRVVHGARDFPRLFERQLNNDHGGC